MKRRHFVRARLACRYSFGDPEAIVDPGASPQPEILVCRDQDGIEIGLVIETDRPHHSDRELAGGLDFIDACLRERGAWVGELEGV